MWRFCGYGLNRFFIFLVYFPKQDTLVVLSSKEKKSAAAGRAARGAELWAPGVPAEE